MKTRLTTSIAAVSLIALSVAGCGSSTSTAEGGATVIKKGKLSVCTQLPYQPFEFRQGSDVVGFDISMMDLVAKNQGLTVNIVQTPFEGIQSGEALNTGQCDIAAAGMTITDARAKVMDFTDPYFDATQAMLVKKGGAKSLDELAGKTIAVQQGTTGEIYTKENAPKDTKIQVFEDLGLLTTAVKTGQVDAGVKDNGPLLDFVRQNPDIEVTTEFKTGEQYGFAVKKGGNDKLLAATNDVIKKAKADGPTTTSTSSGSAPLPSPDPAQPPASPVDSPPGQGATPMARVLANVPRSGGGSSTRSWPSSSWRWSCSRTGSLLRSRSWPRTSCRSTSPS